MWTQTITYPYKNEATLLSLSHKAQGCGFQRSVLGIVWFWRAASLCFSCWVISWAFLPLPPAAVSVSISQSTGCPGAPRAVAAQTPCALGRPPQCCPCPSRDGHWDPWLALRTIFGWIGRGCSRFWQSREKRMGLPVHKSKILGGKEPDCDPIFLRNVDTWNWVCVFIAWAELPWHLKFPCWGGMQTASDPHIRGNYLVWGPFVLFLIAGSDSRGLIQWLWTWKNLSMITSLFCPAWIYDMLWSSFSGNQELEVVVSHQYSQITAKKLDLLSFKFDFVGKLQLPAPQFDLFQKHKRLKMPGGISPVNIFVPSGVKWPWTFCLALVSHCWK